MEVTDRHTDVVRWHAFGDRVPLHMVIRCTAVRTHRHRAIADWTPQYPTDSATTIEKITRAGYGRTYQAARTRNAQSVSIPLWITNRKRAPVNVPIIEVPEHLIDLSHSEYISARDSVSVTLALLFITLAGYDTIAKCFEELAIDCSLCPNQIP